MATAIAVKPPSTTQHSGFAGFTSVTRSCQAPRLRPVPASGPIGTTSSIDRLGNLQVVAGGRTIVEEGDAADHVFKVVSGALRVVRLLPDGRRSVIDFLLPGDVFGLSEDRVCSHSLEALSDASYVRYPKEQVRRLLDRDPRTAAQFLNLICAQLSAAQELMMTLCRKTAVERIASFLLSMADRSKALRMPGATTVRLPMNRADIADHLGLTIETVSRVLTQLRERSIIDIPTASQIVLRDRERLAAIGSGEVREAPSVGNKARRICIDLRGKVRRFCAN